MVALHCIEHVVRQDHAWHTGVVKHVVQHLQQCFILIGKACFIQQHHHTLLLNGAVFSFLVLVIFVMLSSSPDL